MTSFVFSMYYEERKGNIGFAGAVSDVEMKSLCIFHHLGSSTDVFKCPVVVKALCTYKSSLMPPKTQILGTTPEILIQEVSDEV